VSGKPRYPHPPTGLSPASRALWGQIHTNWKMDDAGRVLLSVALEARDRSADARAIVRKEGLTLGARAHPLLAVIRDSENVALKAWRQLGLETTGPMGRPPGKGPA